MIELADESVGLVVTSPPYWVGMEYEEDVSFEGHLEMLDKVFSGCSRVVVPGGKICVNFGDIHNFGTRNGGKPEIKLMGHHYQEILGRHGLRLINKTTWKKCTPGKRDFNWFTNPQANYSENTRHTSYRNINNTENIYVFEKNGKRDVDPEIEKVSRISKEEYYEWVDSVWEIPPVRKQKDHPAQFPEELPRRLIKMYSHKGDIVLDPFGGTITTVKVANELDRVGIGYEKDEQYKPAIMKKLGIKKEDLKKPETVPEPKENRVDLVDQFQDAINDFLSFDGRSENDITIEWNTEEDDPDSSGPLFSPQICKPDDYDGYESYPFQLSKTGTID